MLKEWMGNPYIWFGSLLISLFFGLFGLYTWFVGRKRKEISFDISTHALVQAGKCKYPKLEIAYNNKNISSLYATTIYIWNSGNEVLNFNSDIVKSESLKIESDYSNSILDAEIINECEKCNQFKIEDINGRMIVCSFDYVEPGEGFAVQILHSSLYDTFSVKCKIKGGKQIRNCHKEREHYKKHRVNDHLSYILGTFLDAISIALSSLVTGYIAYLIAPSCSGNESLAVIIVPVLFITTMFFIRLMQKIKKKIESSFYRTIPVKLMEQTFVMRRV